MRALSRITAVAALCAAAALACGRDETNPPPTLRYVALGDSAGFGIGALPGDGGYPPRLARRLIEAGRRVELVNLSIPGATASDVRTFELPFAVEGGADLVTLCIGANDVGRERAREAFAADIEAILARLDALGAPVVVCNVPDLTLTPSGSDEPPAYAERILAFNAEIAAAATRHGDALVDLYAASRERLLARPELVSPDGFHPSPAGYEEWAEIMWPAVKAAAGIP